MRRQADGFSLIEALIAVALVSIVAGISVPMVATGLKRYTLISAGQQVASTIRAARFQAVGRNETLRVRFNHPVDGQYQVLDAANNDVGDPQVLPDGVSFDDGFVDLEITAAGRVATASTIVVTNGNAEDNRTITVSQSGRVILD